MKIIVTPKNYTKFIKLLAVLSFLVCTNFNSLTAQTAEAFKIRYSTKLRGDLTLISNNIVNRDNNVNGQRANDPYSGSTANDWSNMRYIDVDNDSNTFSSSSATLNIGNSSCLNVKFAGLYWGAIYKNSNRDVLYKSVKFKLPGSSNYIDLVADEVIFDDQGVFTPDPYACFVDVTSYVQALASPIGEYTVANIFVNQGKAYETSPAGGAAGGWTLVVVYEDPVLTNKNITLFDGFSGVRSGVSADILVTGFTTIPTGTVHARIGVSCIEGDFGLGGDRYSILTAQNAALGKGFTTLSDAVNPANNFFNSSITIDGAHYMDRVPNSLNTMGWDTDLFKVANGGNSVIGWNETAATLRLGTSQDTYFVFQTSFAIEIIEPKITVLKTVDNGVNDVSGADVVLGESLWYQLRFQNSGNDDATSTIIKDILPINVDLIESSIIFPSGITYTYTDPTATSGGILEFTIDDNLVTKGATYYDIRFNVEITSNCNDLRDACENKVENLAFAYYKGIDSGTEISDDPSFYGLDNCSFGLSGATNFLVNVDGCTFSRDEVLCGSSLELSAGEGYVSYVWTDAVGNNVGSTQTITVTNVGVYTVEKTAASPCVNATETITVVPFGSQTNPLIALDGSVGYLYVDEVKTCPNDGRKLSEIYLCGTNDSRDIITNITGVDEIKWQKLQNNIGNADTDCPNLDITSTWLTVDTTNNFTATDVGEYRLELIYSGGCFVRYYFNVFKSTVTPNITQKNIFCGVDGLILISGIDTSLYEFSVVLDGQAAGTFSSTTNYAISTEGNYTVYFRQIGANPLACVPKIEEINITKSVIKTTITTTDILCEAKKGSIRVQVNDVDGDYKMVLQTMLGAAIGTFGPDTFNDHLFEDLDAGFYKVIVTTPECSETIEDIEIKLGIPLELTAVVSQNITCVEGIIKLSSSGGGTLHNYALERYRLVGDAWTIIPDNSYLYQTSQTFNIPLTGAGIYKFIVVDDNLCTTVSNEVQIILEPDVAYVVSTTDVTCFGSSTGVINITPPTNLNGNNLSFALDDGIVGNGVLDAILLDGSYDDATFGVATSFINLPAGDYTLIVRVQKGGSSCDFPQNVTISQPLVGLSGQLSLTQEYTCIQLGEIAVDLVGANAVSGGTLPYTYAIDGVSFGTSNVFTNLTNGTYTVTIKDANNCVFVTNAIAIDSLNPPTDLTFSTTPISCPTLKTDITVSVVDGDSPFIYEIIAPASAVLNNGNSNVFIGLLADTYTVKVTDAKGCKYEEDFTVKAIKEISVTGVVDNNVLCKGTATGKATFTITGFASTYSYTINAAAAIGTQNATNITVPNLNVGNYSIEVTDETTNCTNTFTVTITEPTVQATMTLASTPITCTTNATITGTATGGWGAFEYQLETNTGTIHTVYSTDPLFTNVLAGDYIVFAKDGNGCVIEEPINISGPINPTVSITIDSECYTSTGSITITASGTGNAPLQYAIDGGSYQSSPSFSGILPGNHSVTIKDVYGCTAISSNSIGISPELTLQLNYLNIKSCGTTTDIIITANGGDGSYTYAGAPTGVVPVAGDYNALNVITIGAVGTYDIYVKDGNNCISFEIVTIKKDPALTILASATPILCSGESTTITGIGVGGEAPYKYRLENASGTMIRPFQTSPNFDNVPVGNYRVKVKDARNCNAFVVLNITEPEYLIASAGVSELVSCNNDLDAEVRITNPEGGTPFASPDLYRFSFDGGLTYTTSNSKNLPSGTHTVYVKDANDCTFAMEVIVAAKLTPPNYNQRVTYDCLGNGTFTVFALDPTSLFSYTYTLDGGSDVIADYTPPTYLSPTGFIFSGLPVGIHTVSMNFTPVATPTKSVLLEESFGSGANTPITQIDPVYCYEPQDGTNTCLNPSIYINDGEYCVTQKIVLPYGSWRNPNDHSGMVNGRFLAMNIGAVAGSNGIIYEKDVNDIIPNRDITISLFAFNLLRNSTGGVDPSIVIELVNSSGVVLATSPIAPAIPKNMNADDWHEFIVTLNPGAYTSLTIVIRSGSTATGGNDIAIDDIFAYQEPEQCPTTTSMTFQVQSGKAFKAATNTITDTTCNGGSDGSISFQVSSYNPMFGYQYSMDGGTTWSASQYSPNFTVNGLNAGAHAIEIAYVSDAIGTKDCIETITETIGEPTAVVASALIMGNLTCVNTGATINASAVGGGGSYEYQLEDTTAGVIRIFQTSANFDNVPVGSYIIRVKDVFGCDDIIDAQIDIVAPTSIGFNLIETNCYQGDSNGSITVNVTAGNGNYQFSINGSAVQTPSPVGALTYTFSNLISGVYTIGVRDQFGCTATDVVTIASQLKASALLVNDIDCNAPTEGEILINANGGAGSNTYEWSDDGGVTWNSSNIIGNIFTIGVVGDYVFQVTDAASCTAITNAVTLTPANNPLFTLTATDIMCNGSSTGAIDVSINTAVGLAPYGINVAGYGTQTTGLPAGTYNVTVTDAKGCFTTNSVTIAEPTVINGNIVTTDITCELTGTELGTVTVDAGGSGTGPYTYQVYNNDYSFDQTYDTSITSVTNYVFVNLDFGDYKVVIIDGNGCEIISDITIGTSPDILVTIVGGATCSTGSITVQANTSSGSLSTGPYYFAKYPIATVAPAGAGWYVGIPGVLPDAVTATEEYTFNGLTPGVTYTFVVYDVSTGCTYIQEADKLINPLSTLTSTIDVITTITCTGASDGMVDFTIDNYDGAATQVDYQVYQTVTINPVGGVGSFTGLTGMPASDTLTGLAPGEYFIQFTEINGGNPGCITTSDAFLIEQSPILLEISASSTKNENCNEQGIITAHAEYGTAPYEYQIQLSTATDPIVVTWTGGNTSGTFNVTNGTYKVFVKDAFNCIQGTGDVIVILDPSPIISVTTDYTGCPSEGIFSVSISLDTAGIPPYSIQINGGASQVITDPFNTLTPIIITGLSSGVNTFQISDVNGCSEAGADSVTIVAPTEIKATITKLLDCSGTPNATIRISDIVGSGNYTYQVDNLTTSTNYIAAGTALPVIPFDWTGADVQGVYEIIITDTATTCSASTTVTVVDKLLPIVKSFSTTDVTCNGAADGTITITADDNGIGPFTFAITAPAAIASTTNNGYTATFENLPGTVVGIDYTITITAANGCTVGQLIMVKEPVLLTIDAVTSVPFGCTTGNIANMASISVTTISGGSGAYPRIEFVNSDGSVVQDGTSTILTIEYDTTLDTYNVDMGGIGTPGEFTINVYDSNGCLATSTETLALFDEINDATITIIEAISCANAGEDIQINVVSINPVTNQFQFSDDNGATWQGSNLFNDLAVGSHNFVIKHNLTSCEFLISHNVYDPNTFTAKVNIINQVSCKGGTGEVTFELVDATYPGGFDWEIFDTLDVTTGITGTEAGNGPSPNTTIVAGSYYVIITQNNLPTCNNPVYFTITEPIVGLTGNRTFTDITCLANDGHIQITPNGGWGNYEYYVGIGAPTVGAWVSSPSFSGLAAGTYEVWFRDMTACALQLPDVVLVDATAITATLTINNPNCYGAGGEIEVTSITGGEGTTYVYQLFLNGTALGSPQSNPVFSGLGVGSYHVDITDLWDCSGTTGTDIVLFDVLLPIVKIVKEIDCTTSPEGEITVTVTGGSGNYQYDMTLPDTSTRTNSTGVFTNLGPTGTYTTDITDLTTINCTTSISVDLNAPSTVVLLLPSSTDVKCNGGSDGTITVNLDLPIAGTNDEPVYTYEITAPIVVVAQNSNVFKGLAQGTYNVLVRSSKGCIATQLVTISEPIALTVTASAGVFACTASNLTNTVVITATAFDGMPGYLYSSNGVNYSSSNTFDIVDTGLVQTITISVKDANGCIATTAPVVINPLVAITAVTVTQNIAISCINPENVTVTVTGGSGDFTYVLLPVGTNTVSVVSSTSNFDLPTKGDYTFKIIDNITGCFVLSSPYTVAPFDGITVEAVATTEVQCFGDANGGLSFNVLNYTGAFSWEVFDAANVSIVNGNNTTANNPIAVAGLSGTSYTIQVIATDPAYCPATSNVVVVASPSDALTLVLDVSHRVTCNPGADGEITAIGNFGWGTYQYQLELGATTLVPFGADYEFSNLTAGVYTVRLRDKNGCTIFETITIAAPLLITAGATANTILCYGDLTGEIGVVANGGQGAGTYVYSLIDNNGNATAFQSDPVFSNLAAGTYTVLVSDDLSCDVITSPVTIIAPAIVVASARLTTTLSCTVAGEILVTASGGDGGPYTYSEDGITFNTINTFTVDPATITNYQYFVKDASGCVSNVSNGITVRPIVPLTVIIDSVNAVISCYGGNNGMISAITSGGMGNYIYELLDKNDVLIDGPQNSSIFTDLGAGTYKVRVTSLDCVETSLSFTLNDPKELVLSAPADATNISCFGEVDGTITVYAVGGTGKLIYSIDQSKFVSDNVFLGLEAGVYTVTAQDENGCYINQEVTIIEPPVLELNFGSINQEKCVDDIDGSIEVVITGGTAPYFTRLNDEGAFEEGKFIYDNLLGGITYVIYVEDSSGCKGNILVKLEEPVELNFGTTIDYACDGNIKIIASVDSQFENEVTYTMVTSTQTMTNTTGVFDNLAPGEFLVEVEHDNGCIPSQSYVEVTAMISTIVTLEESFVNTITANVSQGMAPYEYSFDGEDFGDSNQFIVNKTGTYVVEVRDVRGCISTAEIDMEFISVFIPNFFTPDGDGTNDYWYPRKLMAYPNIKVSIYDRYSRLIANFRGPQIGWDGTLNGKALPSGDYWYVIDLDGVQGDKRKMMGNFTLYR